MIAVDTSALVAIALGEPKSGACIEALEASSHTVISAGTVAEMLVVSVLRNVDQEMTRLLDRFDFDIEVVTPASARRIGKAYQRWGKGVHPAGLNFGDCFAYEIAKQHSCPLLFVGNDFSKTDIESVL